MIDGKPCARDCYSDIRDWLLTDGRLHANYAETLKGFIDRLLSTDMAILRFFLGTRAIHPQIAASAFLWNKGADGITIVARDHQIMQSNVFHNSPLFLIYEKGATFIRRRLTENASLAAPSLAEESTMDFPILDDLRKLGATDYMVLALPQSSGARASLSLATDRPSGFHDHEIEGIKALVPILSLMTETYTNARNAATILDVYLGKNTGKRILEGQIRRGEGVTMAAAIWYCDLRNFTAMSSMAPRHEIIATLNDYFEAMGRPIEGHGGEILKFIGDSILAIFPMQDDLDRDRACRSALDAALDGLQNLRDLNDLRASQGKERLKVGIGLHAGSVTYGNIGTKDRLDFTVIGTAVNMANRLEALCRPLGESLLASKTFASPCGFKLALLGEHELPGIPGKQEVYGLPR